MEINSRFRNTQGLNPVPVTVLVLAGFVLYVVLPGCILLTESKTLFAKTLYFDHQQMINETGSGAILSKAVGNNKGSLAAFQRESLLAGGIQPSPVSVPTETLPSPVRLYSRQYLSDKYDDADDIDEEKRGKLESLAYEISAEDVSVSAVSRYLDVDGKIDDSHRRASQIRKQYAVPVKSESEYRSDRERSRSLSVATLLQMRRNHNAGQHV